MRTNEIKLHPNMQYNSKNEKGFLADLQKQLHDANKHLNIPEEKKTKSPSITIISKSSSDSIELF